MVSVIVPIYNVEPYLNQCIDSILAQTFTDLEIILIDDGSTDNCGEICDSYLDSRITVYHTENRGLSAARNLGVRKSHGEYICFIDSDDWIDSGLIEQAIQKIGKADILCFENEESNYSGFEAMCALINEKINKAAWNKLYRRECFTELLFPEGVVMEEVATTYMFLYNADNVRCAAVPGYHYRIREGSITQTHSIKNLLDCWHAYKERFEYCASIVDSETYVNLLKSCAEAIVHVWIWRNENELSDSSEWEEMSLFARKMFPRAIRKRFSFTTRIGLFLARYNNNISFEIAYKMNLLRRKIKK